MPPARKLTAVGCYIFAGGFTVGMGRHFKILAHIEDGRFGVNTFKHNFPSVPVYQQDEHPDFDHVDVIYGNPPCSAWSTMGSFSDGHAWAADRDWRESRRNCSEKFLEVFIRYQPRVWVMESVTQLTTKGREFVNRVMTTGRDLGYAGWLVFHDPKFMGIAQTRRRVLMVLSRVDIRWNPPSGVMTSMRDVIKKLPTPRKFILIPQPDSYWWKVARDGEDFVRAWERSGARPVLKPKHKTAHRISLDTPMGTIHSDGHFGHHTECRFLTGEELAVINGYPSDYKWSQSDARTRTEVAKGVSPVVGDWLGRCLKQSLVTNKPASTGVLTTINFMAKSQRRSDAVMLNEVKVGEM